MRAAVPEPPEHAAYRAGLAAQAHRHRTEGKRFDLSDELIDFLSERDLLVVIDEAQWLNRECIEYLRHLHDDPAPRFGLLLARGDGCWEVLSREPMLRSRLHRRVAFGPLDRAAVLQAIPAYHALYRDADVALIALIDDVLAKATSHSPPTDESSP